MRLGRLFGSCGFGSCCRASAPRRRKAIGRPGRSPWWWDSPPAAAPTCSARIVARKVSEVLGQQIIIENVGGAGGMVGSARVAKSPPDGYTIVMGTRADAINQTLYKKPAYNLLEDLVPIVLIADQPTILITPNEFPANTMPEFIDYVKKNQATLKVASAGAGSTGMIDCQLLNAAIGVNVTHVPYRGGGPAMQDIIGGRVDYICTLDRLGGAAGRGQDRQGDRRADQGARADAAERQELMGAGLQGSRSLDLVQLHGAEGHAGAGHQAAARRHRDGDGGQRGAEADAGVGRHRRPPERRSTEYLKDYMAKEIEKNGAPIRAAGLSIE